MPQTSSKFKELYRCKLNDEEIADPYLAIRKLYDSGSIDEVRNRYETLLEVVYTESYGELDSDEKWFLVEFLKNLEILLEANYVFYKIQDTKKRAFSHQEIEVARILQNPETSNFDKVVAVVKTISDPGKIYKIKSCPDATTPQNSKYDLLVLLDHPEVSFIDMQERIDAACGHLGSVLITFRRLGDLVRYFKTGHILYSAVCTEDNLLYGRNERPIPFYKNIDYPKLIGKARTRFDNEFKKAQAFRKGAEHHISNKSDLNLCAFMLHQATEHAVRAVLMGYMDYEIIGHNLFVLLRHVHRFSEEIIYTLSKGTPTDNALLTLLNEAYTHTRYTNKYKITLDQANLLLDRVTSFHNAIVQTFDERLQAFLQKNKSN